MIWKIWKKSKLNSEKIWKIWKLNQSYDRLQYPEKTAAAVVADKGIYTAAAASAAAAAKRRR
jgi:hypothetical protein